MDAVNGVGDCWVVVYLNWLRIRKESRFAYDRPIRLQGRCESNRKDLRSGFNERNFFRRSCFRLIVNALHTTVSYSLNNALSLRGSNKLANTLRGCWSEGTSCNIEQLRDDMAQDSAKQDAGYIPGVSQYVVSNLKLNSPTLTSATLVVPTASCANGDLACKSGVGVEFRKKSL